MLVVTPAYVKPSQNGLVKFYEMVADQGALPVVLYNVSPARANSTFARTHARTTHTTYQCTVTIISAAISDRILPILLGSAQMVWTLSVLATPTKAKFGALNFAAESISLRVYRCLGGQRLTWQRRQSQSSPNIHE